MKQKVIIKTQAGKWLFFEDPIRILAAYRPDDVENVINQACSAADNGKYAVGFISYEASPGFDEAMTVKETKATPIPLVWFGVYENTVCRDLPAAQAPAASFDINWQSDTAYDEYHAAIEKIKRYIEEGHTYQVNYTIRLNAEFKYEPFDFFTALAHTCNAQYCCFIETDDFAICSFSPELFFKIENGHITARPVKGTIARGLTNAADKDARDRLSGSRKDMAENVMIVDIIRNDLGKIALPGTVEVPQLFEIEKYPTLYQMSSKVTADTVAGIAEVIKEIFPCASITGAPKCKTMGIIAELEKSPRGIYTGSIGYISPGGGAVFNVAIRTAAIDKTAKTAVYGVGGGILWDSTAQSEYAECLTKAKVLTPPADNFSLLESILWTKRTLFYLKELHLKRLAASADYFDYKFDQTLFCSKMNEAVENCGEGEYKVRLVVAKDGSVSVDVQKIEPSANPLKLAIAPSCINSGNVFLYHKTTNRYMYEQAYSHRGHCDEVILWNERGEITECTFHNIAFEKDGLLYTPPVECGLLAGVMRQEMLNTGELIEKVIPMSEIDEYDNIYLINSVRGKRKAALTQSTA